MAFKMLGWKVTRKSDNLFGIVTEDTPAFITIMFMNGSVQSLNKYLKQDDNWKAILFHTPPEISKILYQSIQGLIKNKNIDERLKMQSVNPILN